MHNTTAVSPHMKSEKPWYKHRWPWFLMIGPVAVILAGSYTGWLAYSQQDALVVDDYYKQGKAINQDLRRDRAAANLGLSLDLRYDPAAGRLNGRLLGYGKPIPGAVQVRLIHSTRPERDISLNAEPDQSGAFSIALPLLEQARWQVQMENTQRDWRLYGTWKWPQEQTIEIKT
ncbi:MAG: cytochrome oxidase assembly protein [Burkholderiales bacterium RIFCSPLOWO2_02_FULL_57_36]|nr:MAG: cytochrome oxidase assembly protein [Burkholderiales bacterium RIFCSPLOWO2_02_FULL_57_36]